MKSDLEPYENVTIVTAGEIITFNFHCKEIVIHNYELSIKFL